MKSKLIQELYRQANRLVQEIFPESAPFRPEHFPSEWRVWRLNRAEKLSLFLILAPSRKGDDFALEIGWSVDGKIPEFHGSPEEDMMKSEAVFRLSRLWHKQGLEQRWYLGSARGPEEARLAEDDLPPELENCSMASILALPENREHAEKLKALGINLIPPKAEPLDVKFASVQAQLEDAFRRLKQCGVPYLKRIASRYECDLMAR